MDGVVVRNITQNNALTDGQVYSLYNEKFFMGGVGRLVSIISVGLPSNIFLFYLTIEFLIPTIMIISKIYLDKHLVD